tara:strand:+ start:417 stop:551 length:135 start_codon:yes stop_codon:yes gene_type:complete
MYGCGEVVGFKADEVKCRQSESVFLSRDRVSFDCNADIIFTVFP